MIFYEDLEIGTQRDTGTYDVTREEVVEFARKYDPQSFHLDDEAAAKTHFGRLSASGWHTCAMTMRLLVSDFIETATASLGSPGIDNLRWVKPVCPGDTLRAESVVIEKRRSRSKPELGLFKSRIRTFNQHDELVLEMVSNGLIQVEHPDAPID